MKKKNFKLLFLILVILFILSCLPAGMSSSYTEIMLNYTWSGMQFSQPEKYKLSLYYNSWNRDENPDSPTHDMPLHTWDDTDLNKFYQQIKPVQNMLDQVNSAIKDILGPSDATGSPSLILTNLPVDKDFYKKAETNFTTSVNIELQTDFVGISDKNGQYTGNSHIADGVWSNNHTSPMGSTLYYEISPQHLYDVAGAVIAGNSTTGLLPDVNSCAHINYADLQQELQEYDKIKSRYLAGFTSPTIKFDFKSNDAGGQSTFIRKMKYITLLAACDMGQPVNVYVIQYSGDVPYAVGSFTSYSEQSGSLGGLMLFPIGLMGGNIDSQSGASGAYQAGVETIYSGEIYIEPAQ